MGSPRAACGVTPQGAMLAGRETRTRGILGFRHMLLKRFCGLVVSCVSLNDELGLG